MKKGLGWKVLLTLAIIVGSLLIFTFKKINRGLDLKGGIHLRLQVITEDAIIMETDQEILRLQELFKKNNITYASITRNSPGKFTIQGTNPDQEAKIKDQLDQYLRDCDYAFAGSSGIHS